jgi:hypothetical protein
VRKGGLASFFNILKLYHSFNFIWCLFAATSWTFEALRSTRLLMPTSSTLYNCDEPATDVVLGFASDLGHEHGDGCNNVNFHTYICRCSSSLQDDGNKSTTSERSKSSDGGFIPHSPPICSCLHGHGWLFVVVTYSGSEALICTQEALSTWSIDIWNTVLYEKIKHSFFIQH